MKILLASRTPHAGLPERTAIALNEHTRHQARALVPGEWLTWKRAFAPDETNSGDLWNVDNDDARNHCLEWADVIACMYNTSLADLGRPDLARGRTVVWHLATKWHDSFLQLFPSGVGSTRLVLSAEGWDRFGTGPWRQHVQVPVVFLLDDPLYQPGAFARRTRHVSMAPRVSLDTTDDGRPIAAPRGLGELKARLAGLKFRPIRRQSFATCMARKRGAWIGIDDLVQPLVHQSGFEYLALGVPCMNRSDGHVRRAVSRATGAADWPFIEAEIETARSVAERALGRPAEEWEERGRVARGWMERNMHPRDVARAYVEAYEGAGRAAVRT